MILAINYGSSSTTFGTSVVSLFPQIITVKRFSDLDIRSTESIKTLFEFAENSGIIPSTVCLFLTVNDHRFKIKMINVREYRLAWEAKYNTKWNKITTNPSNITS